MPLQQVATCGKSIAFLMRKRVPIAMKHTARGVSLPPTMEKAAMQRACALDMSFSRYVQRLIEADLKDKILVHPAGSGVAS